MNDIAGRLTAALADRYLIERELGAGGMATVYLAEDLKHHRKVALKVLKPELAAVIGGDRFLAEITTTANLQHPHILPLLDSGQTVGRSDGQETTYLYYVMPFVEGESLRGRLVRDKQLPVADAVKIAGEIAGALDYAHRQGVIHRDIKPENILLHDGRAVVADFGIALAASRTEGGSRMTETGMSLGTPHYMSPEQAMGERDLDGHTDQYALGCVLYEMLTGEPPFTGPTAQAIVAKVMGGEPELITATRKTVPTWVEDAVFVALSKIPADRFPTAGAFAAALEGPGHPLAGRTRRVRGAPGPSWRSRVLWPAAVAVVSGLAILGWLRTPASGLVLPPTQLALMAPDRGGSNPLGRQIELTPDGSALLVPGGASMLGSTLRVELDGSKGRVLDGVVPFLTDYFISPDGKEFVAAAYETAVAYRYPIGGGTGRPLPRGVRWKQRAAWGHDGSLWISDNSGGAGVVRVSPTDSVTTPFGRVSHGLVVAQVLPGDRTALAVQQPIGRASGPAVLVDLRSGTVTPLIDEAVVGIRYAVGNLVYVLGDGTLKAVPFDRKALRITGAPVVLATGIMLTGTGFAQFSVAANGTVAYLVEAGRSLVLTDRTGASHVVLDEMHSYHHPRFSPDGRRIATDFTGADGRDVWTVNLADRAFTRVTFDRDGHDAAWTSDGRSISYTSFRGGIFGTNRLRPGSAEPAESLLTSPRLGYTGIWLKGDSALITVANALLPDSKLDIAIVRQGGRGPIEPLVATRFDEQFPALSRDGRWLAYASNRSGRDEVYVRPLDGSGGEVQVSLGGGNESVWSPDGSELFYRATGQPGSSLGPTINAAGIVTRPTLAVKARQVLFSATGLAFVSPHSNFDISPDGRTFVFVRNIASSKVMILQNLPAMVERLRTGASR